MTGRSAAPLGLASLLVAMPAWAHGGERAFVLLMPTGYYLVGGTLAVAATFLVLAFMPKGISDRLANARETPTDQVVTARVPAHAGTTLQRRRAETPDRLP